MNRKASSQPKSKTLCCAWDSCPAHRSLTSQTSFCCVFCRASERCFHNFLKTQIKYIYITKNSFCSPMATVISHQKHYTCWELLRKSNSHSKLPRREKRQSQLMINRLLFQHSLWRIKVQGSPLYLSHIQTHTRTHPFCPVGKPRLWSSRFHVHSCVSFKEEHGIQTSSKRARSPEKGGILDLRASVSLGCPSLALFCQHLPIQQ